MEFLDEFYQLLGYVHIRKLVQVANPSNGDLAGAFLSYIWHSIYDHSIPALVQVDRLPHSWVLILPQSRASWRLRSRCISPLGSSSRVASVPNSRAAFFEFGSIGLLQRLYRWVSGPASPGSWTEARIVNDCNVCDLEDISGSPL